MTDPSAEFHHDQVSSLLGPILLGLSRKDLQVFLTDREGTVLWAGEALLGASGYSQSEVLGERLQWLLHGPLTSQDSLAELDRAFFRRDSSRVQILLYRKTGESMWTDWSVGPVQGVPGDAQYSVVLVRDITEERQRKERLDLLDACMARLNDVVIITEAEPLSQPGPRILYVNDAFEKETGYSREEALGQSPRMLQSPKTDRVELDRLKQALVRWESVRVELLNQKKSGEEFWTELDVAPVHDGTGFFTHWVSVQRNISRSREAKQELERAMLELRRTNALLEAAGRIGEIGHWQVFLDGRPPLWSEATYLIHDLEPGVPITLEMAIAFYVPEHQEMVKDRVARCIRHSTRFEFEALLQTTRGDRIWTKSTGEPVFDESGKLFSIQGVIQKIDKQKRAMLALEERDRRLTALSRNVSGILFQLRCQISGEFQFTFMSEAAVTVLGLGDCILGKQAVNRFREQIVPSDLPRVRAELEESLQSLTPLIQEFQYEHPQRGRRWLRVSSTPTLGEDSSTTWHGYLEDVTDLKKIEEQLRQAAERAEAANVAKSVFLSNMSHEMRTPLNAVVGMAEILQGCGLSPEAQSYVSTISTSSQALLSLIEDILDFSKIEADHITLKQEPVAVEGVMESSLAIVAESARQKGLELVYWMEPSVPEWVEADPPRVRQVLLNLLSNAIKFTEHGYIVLSANRVGEGEDHAGWIRFEVEDTGIGIPRESHHRLFQRFSQVQPDATRQYGGTGLGLAICARLVQLMGGVITVDSAEGRGSVFRVDLPLRVLNQDKPLVHPNLRNRHGLLVHCQPPLRSHYDRILKSLGIRVTAVPTGDEAELFLRSQDSPDFVLLDCIRNDFKYQEVVRRLRDLPACSDLPFAILLSSTQMQDDLPGIPGIVRIPKPVRREDLLQSLCNLMAPAHSDPVRSGIQTRAPGLDRSPSSIAPLMSVLIAEDNVVNRRVLTLLLERLGYQCDHAANGLEALEQLAQKTYDIVLMDVQMPVMDGLEATRQIRSRLQAASQPFIVAVTANATAEDREVCLQAGMDYYLSKPVRSEHMQQALEAAKKARMARISLPSKS